MDFNPEENKAIAKIYIVDEQNEVQAVYTAQTADSLEELAMILRALADYVDTGEADEYESNVH